MAVYQQVNFYQPVFTNREKIFCASAVALVLLMTIVGQARCTLNDMHRTARTLEQQLNMLNPRLAMLEADRPTPDTRALDGEIEQLRADIAQRKTLLVQFEQLATEQGNGFALQFHALAEEQVTGLWLEGVTVDDQHRVELRGVTLDARLVPAYLQVLARRPDLSESPFETVSMTRPDANRPQIRFVLRNFKGDAQWD